MLAHSSGEGPHQCEPEDLAAPIHCTCDGSLCARRSRHGDSAPRFQHPRKDFCKSRSLLRNCQQVGGAQCGCEVIYRDLTGEPALHLSGQLSGSYSKPTSLPLAPQWTFSPSPRSSRPWIASFEDCSGPKAWPSAPKPRMARSPMLATRPERSRPDHVDSGIPFSRRNLIQQYAPLAAVGPTLIASHLHLERPQQARRASRYQGLHRVALRVPRISDYLCRGDRRWHSAPNRSARPIDTALARCTSVRDVGSASIGLGFQRTKRNSPGKSAIKGDAEPAHSRETKPKRRLSDRHRVRCKRQVTAPSLDVVAATGTRQCGRCTRCHRRHARRTPCVAPQSWRGRLRQR